MAAFFKRSSMFVFLLLAKAFALVHGQGTRVGFYSASCPQAEFIVQLTVAAYFQSDPAIASGLLRMHFHDCFVRGYDASILINGMSTKKTTIPNRLLKGYDAIDDAKSQIEDVCPGVVSCQFFRYRLYNFSNTSTNGVNPSMDTAFVSQLQKMCLENRDGSKCIALDTSSSDRFDGSFFTNLRNGREILESDQKLRTNAFFLGLRGELNFNMEFGWSMVKMSNIGVKTRTEGEIRRVCTAIN
ncbi:cationic peroxidase 2-like [Vitis riparia]|uniref:cationic peroxidase 2-like n=1 Tax=Vitis riparia TaxID=96939 RepID=UPI00155B073D|nr:cationic peroxidase 2-like [Vitis riparia]